MTKREGMPADWYADPTKVGELRYFDGTKWTEHVTIDGVQTTAPYESPDSGTRRVADVASDPTQAQSFTMSRTAQWRSEHEKALEVVGPAGVLGRYVTLLDGAPGYRFEDAQGGTVLSVSKPSLKSLVEVADPAGYPVGTITKVGRLHSRYDVARADKKETATVKLVAGAVDEWELQLDGGRCATFTRTSSSPADALNFAHVQYAVNVTAPIDDQLQRLVLAVPLAVDILDTQAL